jgi:hypothetical protein
MGMNLEGRLQEVAEAIEDGRPIPEASLFWVAYLVAVGYAEYVRKLERQPVNPVRLTDAGRRVLRRSQGISEMNRE